MTWLSLPDDDRCAAWLAHIVWQTSVLIGAVFLVQWLLRRYLAPRWRHSLWLLVLVRLALPVSWGSPWSIFNQLRLTHAGVPPVGHGRTSKLTPAAAGVAATRANRLEGQTSDSLKGASAASTPLARPPQSGADRPLSAGSPDLAASGQAPERQRHPSGPRHWLFYGWLSGVLVFASYLGVGIRGLGRLLRQTSRVTSQEILSELAACQRVIGIGRPVPLLQTDQLRSPGIFGLFRPRILLPTAVLRGFSPRELRGILLHELGHVRRGDLACNWLVTLLQALYWFHPLVWLAFRRLRAEREAACDAQVLSRSSDQERAEYGTTIIKLLESFVVLPARPGLVGLLEEKHQVKERVQMIASFGRHPSWPGVALAATAALALTLMTDAQSEPPPARPPHTSVSSVRTAPLSSTQRTAEPEGRRSSDHEAQRLRQELRHYEARLQESEDAIAKFRRLHDIDKAEEVADATQQQLGRARDEYLKTKEASYEPMIARLSQELMDLRTTQSEFAALVEQRDRIKAKIENLKGQLRLLPAKQQAVFSGMVKGIITFSADQPKTVATGIIELGYDESAYLKMVMVSRLDLKAKKVQMIPVNVKTVLDGDRSKDLPLQDHDHVVVLQNFNRSGN